MTILCAQPPKHMQFDLDAKMGHDLISLTSDTELEKTGACLNILLSMFTKMIQIQRKWTLIMDCQLKHKWIMTYMCTCIA